MNKKRHILVTGPHRSGTTWIGKTISKHPKVEYIHEPFNVDFKGYNFDYQFQYWFEHVPTSNHRKDIEDVFDKYIPVTAGSYAAKICRESGYSLKTPLLYAKYLMLASDMPHYLIKDPIALISAGWLYERYSMQVICVTRNPLAFAGSLKTLNWDFDFDNFLSQEGLMKEQLSAFYDEILRVKKEGDFIDRIALLWNVLNHIILEYRRSYPEWLFLTHEELSLEPVKGFKSIFNYLDLEFDQQISLFVKEFTSSQNPQEVDTHEFQARDSEKLLFTWKNRLTVDEANRIEEATQKIYYEMYGKRLLLE
ncbi:MAG: sulfotransferase domain-containing protein [Candidatus Paceibacterota bacterium]